ncbi:Biotin carboxyl carrier protein of acetyl-CoA carboxylase [Amycolatopsis sp. YIM 10]|nr:Biotin carboxyl carrier protein of acetyl-CoA carboxylase [Amycolatopsis sp. YIM 10]
MEPASLATHNGRSAEPAPGTPALETVIDAVAAVVRAMDDSRATRVRVRVGETQIEVESAERERAPGAPAVADTEDGGGGQVAISAPVVGVFYRGPGPGEPPFIEIGSTVSAGQQLGIVEAMKLMNPVVTDCAGVVRAIQAEDGEIVEYAQPLVLVEPS